MVGLAWIPEPVSGLAALLRVYECGTDRSASRVETVAASALPCKEDMMPPRPLRYVPLQPVPPDQLPQVVGLPAVRQLKATFPKRALTGRADARAALRRWEQNQPAPAAVRNPDVPVKAVRLTRDAVAKLRAVADSDVAPSEFLNQKFDQDSFFGTLYSTLAAYEFMQLQSEYKRRRAAPGAATRVDQEWKRVVNAAQTAFAAAGLAAVQEPDLNRFVQELTASRANLNTVVRLASTAAPVAGSAALTARTAVTASFVPTVGTVRDLSDLVTHIADLCDDPIAQGSFTKHFARSISLSVKIRYWCPTWTNPFRTCTKTFTIAGVSFSIGVTVGYKVNCCGATAWGQAHAQVCATIVGISVCASCTATITGVAGVSRTPVSGGCSYGLGITAVLQCKLAGATILNLSWPFGWTVTGPCPPAGLCP